MSIPGASGIDPVRRSVSHRVLTVLWLHVLLLVAFEFGPETRVQGMPALGACCVAGALAIAGSAASGLAARVPLLPVLALLLGGMSNDVAWALSGTPWHSAGDLDATALLALLALTRNGRIAAAGAAVIVLPGIAIGAAGLFARPQESAAPLILHAGLMLIPASLAIWCAGEVARIQAENRANLEAAAQAALRDQSRLRLMAEAASDLSAQAAEDRLAREFESEIGGLVGDAALVAGGVRAAAAQVSSVTESASRRTMAIAEASEQTWASAQSVAASVDDLANSIRRVTGDVREVSESSFRAMDEAMSTNQTVQELANTAGRIGTIVGKINKISAQTNLLALNATIEASRAGEAGLGFSVVANEVKQLALQTAGATQEIEREIASIRSEMKTAMAAIDGMAATVANLGGITVSVSCAMEEQGDIAHQIAASAMRAAEGTQAVVANLRALTEETENGDRAARDGSRDADLLASKCREMEAAARNFVRALLAA